MESGGSVGKSIGRQAHSPFPCSDRTSWRNSSDSKERERKRRLDIRRPVAFRQIEIVETEDRLGIPMKPDADSDLKPDSVPI
jgi:hypothetical protein